MTVDEASAAAIAAGNSALEPTNMPGVYSLGPPPISTTNMTFCKGRLFAISTSLMGGVDAFASQAAHALSTYGNPRVTASQDYTDKGLLSDVRLTWLANDDEEVALSVNSYAGGTSVNLSHSAFKGICE